MRGQWEFDESINVRHKLDDEAFGSLERVMVTPASYPGLFEVHHFDIRSTVRKTTLCQHQLRPSQACCV